MTKAVQIKGRTVVFEVSNAGTIENPKLKFVAYSEDTFSDDVERLIADRINFFLSLQDDLKEFYKIACQDDKMKPAIKQFYGHKQVKFITPFEIACWAVINQRIQMTVARRMKERIIERIGGHLKVKEVEYEAFPEASVLARVEPASLLEMVPYQRKAEYVLGVAKAFNNIDEGWLRSGPYDEVYQWLRSIKGIGEWSANFIMIRGLGRMEKLSTIGPELALDAGRVYAKRDEPITDEEVCEIAEKYGNWKGYWAYYLRIYAEFTYVFEKGKKQLTR